MDIYFANGLLVRVEVGPKQGTCHPRGYTVVALRADNVCKRYGGRTVVDGVCAVEAGEIVGLLGPNGAGKRLRSTVWLAL